MRTVGQVLLALAVLAGALAGGFQAAGAVPGATSPGSVPSDLPADAITGVLDAVTHAAGAPPATGDGPESAAGSPSAFGEQFPASTHAASGAATGAGPAPEIGATTDLGTAAQVGATNESAATARDDVDVLLEQVFRLTPERPGRVTVTYDYSLADRIVTLETAVPERATSVRTDGFVARNETGYAWDETTARPSITFSLPVNETGSRDHVTANGSLLFADVGEWALFQRPATNTHWEAIGRDPVAYDRRTRTAGPGAAGEWLVYLGEVALHPRTTSQQTFRLAVPAAANMTESPDEVLDALERASADIDVGDRDEGIFAVAAPTEGVPWAVRGLSTGESDFWVGADERLAVPENVWVHEYVHTRQDYRPTSATRWTEEGFATYYAARYAFQHEPLSFERFASSLAVGTNGSANVTLTDPESWAGTTAYDRGALVAAQLDRRLRLRSDGERSIDSILAAMNAVPGRMNGTEFLARIGTIGGESVREWTAAATRTDRPIDVWNRSRHVAAFGSFPARFVYGLPPADATSGYRVTGPFRNATLRGDAPLSIVTGESLVVDAQARNVGDSAGFYDVELRVDGRVVADADGQLAENGTETVPLTHAFSRPGEYAVTVGNETRTVHVSRPATGSIVGLNIARGSIPQYGMTTIDVTVRNDSPRPANRTLTIRRDGEAVRTQEVRLGPNDTEVARVNVRFPTAGTTEVGVDDAGSLPVEVRPGTRPTATPTATPTSNGTSTDTPGVTAPGIATLAALCTLFAALLVARYGR